MDSKVTATLALQVRTMQSPPRPCDVDTATLLRRGHWNVPVKVVATTFTRERSGNGRYLIHGRPRRITRSGTRCFPRGRFHEKRGTLRCCQRWNCYRRPYLSVLFHRFKWQLNRCIAKHATLYVLMIFLKTVCVPTYAQLTFRSPTLSSRFATCPELYSGYLFMIESWPKEFNFPLNYFCNLEFCQIPMLCIVEKRLSSAAILYLPIRRIRGSSNFFFVKVRKRQVIFPIILS